MSICHLPGTDTATQTSHMVDTATLVAELSSSPGPLTLRRGRGRGQDGTRLPLRALEARHQEIEEAIDRPTPGPLTRQADATTPPQTLRAAVARLVKERLQ